MENSKTTHWGAALIIGLCTIAAAVLGAVFVHGKAEQEIGQVKQDRAASVSEMQQQVEARDAEIRELTAKVQAQEALASKLQNEMDTLKVRAPATPEGQPRVSPSSAGDQAQQPTQPSGASATTVDEAGFRFVLQKCTRAATSATCRLSITNNSKERTLSVIYPLVPVPNNSRTVDSTGSQHRSDVSVGGSLEATLPTGLTISAVLGTPIDEDSTSLNLLELELWASGGDSRAERILVRFRNVPLNR